MRVLRLSYEYIFRCEFIFLTDVLSYKIERTTPPSGSPSSLPCHLCRHKRQRHFRRWPRAASLCFRPPQIDIRHRLCWNNAMYDRETLYIRDLKRKAKCTKTMKSGPMIHCEQKLRFRSAKNCLATCHDFEVMSMSHRLLITFTFVWLAAATTTRSARAKLPKHDTTQQLVKRRRWYFFWNVATWATEYDHQPKIRFPFYTPLSWYCFLQIRLIYISSIQQCCIYSQHLPTAKTQK